MPLILKKEVSPSLHKRTALIYDERMVEHKCVYDPEYPERPERFSMSLEKCKSYGLVERCLTLPSRSAKSEEILLLHEQGYVDLFKSIVKNPDPKSLEKHSSKYDSVYFHPKTYDLSLLAVGSTIDLVTTVVTGKAQNGMAIIRPPGHHAMKAEFCGYCFFNNVALSAKHALDNLKLKKILIVDWDVHHGQGTQYFFYDDPRVLYFSIHRYEHGAFWPELRESNYDFIGKGKGKGYNINVPLNSTGLGNADYLAIFNNILLPVAYEFNPDLILVSAGYDAAFGCPEGEMEVTPACYAHLVHSLSALAQGKLCIVLEGGYFLESLAESVAMTLRGLLGDPCPVIGSVGEPSDSVVDTIYNVISTLRPFWRSLAFQESYKPGSPNEKKEKRHALRIEYKGQLSLKRPESFPTKEYYQKHSPAKLAQLRMALKAIVAKSNLSVSRHRVALAFDPTMSLHQSFLEKVHPERPDRILKIYEKLKDEGLVDRCYKLSPRHATEEELLLAHSLEYVNCMKATSAMSPPSLLELQEHYKSVYLCPASYGCATLAAGFLFQAVDSVLSGTSRAGVAVVRPPGHHAESNEACGFCIFNNVALAARYALDRYSLKRILIVDWDVHHGNGIQHQFEDDPKVLYLSLHRYENTLFFPFSYDADYKFVGKGKGEGFNVNIPWSKGRMSDGDYMAAFFQLVLPIARQFDPELVLVASGFDAARGDPLGGCRLSPEIFGHFTHHLSSLANGRIVVALEGGYNVPIISSCMAHCISALLGDPLTPLTDNLNPCPSAVATIKETSKFHAKYWSCLKFNDISLPEFSYAWPESKNIPEVFEVGSKKEKQIESKMEASGGADKLPESFQIFVSNMPSEMFAVQPLTWCPHLSDLGAPPTQGLDPKSPCEDCSEVSENWVCLGCFQVHCGRHVRQHMLKHWKTKGHPLTLSYSDLSVWCYECDSYLDNPALDCIKDDVHFRKFGLSRLSLQ